MIETRNTMIEELKTAMQYTEDPPPRCYDCKFASYMADLGNGPEVWCNLNPAVRIPITSTGRCKFFDKKVSTSTVPT